MKGGQTRIRLISIAKTLSARRELLARDNDREFHEESDQDSTKPKRDKEPAALHLIAVVDCFDAVFDSRLVPHNRESSRAPAEADPIPFDRLERGASRLKADFVLVGSGDLHGRAEDAETIVRQRLSEFWREQAGLTRDLGIPAIVAARFSAGQTRAASSDTAWRSRVAQHHLDCDYPYHEPDRGDPDDDRRGDFSIHEEPRFKVFFASVRPSRVRQIVNQSLELVSDQLDGLP